MSFDLQPPATPPPGCWVLAWCSRPSCHWKWRVGSQTHGNPHGARPVGCTSASSDLHFFFSSPPLWSLYSVGLFQLTHCHHASGTGTPLPPHLVYHCAPSGSTPRCQAAPAWFAPLQFGPPGHWGRCLHQPRLWYALVCSDLGAAANAVTPSVTSVSISVQSMTVQSGPFGPAAVAGSHVQLMGSRSSCGLLDISRVTEDVLVLKYYFSTDHPSQLT